MNQTPEETMNEFARRTHAIIDLRALTTADQILLKWKNFGKSLLTQFDEKDRLSDRQWPYVLQIVAESQEALARPTQPVETKPALATEKIRALFDDAIDNGLKSPSLLIGDEDHEIKLSLAKPESKNAGSIYVVLDKDYIGRIKLDGSLVKTASTDVDVHGMLTRFLVDPASEARAYGKRTGICCCCGRTLTNPDSIAAGIGPICAGGWGF